MEGDVEGSSNVGVDSGTGGGAGGTGGEKGEPEEEHPLQRLIYPLISVFQLVIRSSYIATNIVMMVSVLVCLRVCFGVSLSVFWCASTSQ